VPLIDDPGSHAVRVRLSRATTDGSEGRDVFGIAIRIGGDAAPTDLLFASTGDSGVGRFALQVRRRIDDGPLTTMLPMTCASGSMILRLVPASDHEFALSRASARGSWHPVGLLTLKPTLFVGNIGEEDIRNPEGNPHYVRLMALAAERGAPCIPICSKLEAEIQDLPEEDRPMFLEEAGLTEPGLNVLIHASYDLLGLQTYFTAGVKEVRAWTIHKGDTAPQAAGVIHTDFEKGFIRAQVIAYEDFIQYGGEQGAKDAGKMRTEGKEYVVKDGDLMNFLFNV